MSELVFEVTQESDGSYIAEALCENIVTEAETWGELRANVQEAVEAYYFEEQKADPRAASSQTKDEVLAVA